MMADVKLVMIFPNPVDAEAFDQALASQTLSMLAAGLGAEPPGRLTRVLGAPGGQPPFFRIVEIYFPTREALEAKLATHEAQAAAANAIAISSGGTPIFLVCDEVTLPFG
jgi:hypothetical protein